MKRLRQKIKRLFGGETADGGDRSDDFSAKSVSAPVSRLLQRARAQLDRGQPAEALKLVREASALGESVRGLFFLEGLCLEQAGRHDEALRSFARELVAHRDHAAARRHHDQLTGALARPARRQISTAERPWPSSLPHSTLATIQQALHNYHYRGVPMLKNPFDLALYPMLVWQARPRTVFEIGSKSGGSGLWFGDMLDNFGLEAHVYSVDIVRVSGITHPRVTFLEGDGRALEKTLTAEFIDKLPRPWLVIEDADHAYETSIAVLRFFHPRLRPGEYIVVEDGIISDLSNDAACNSGPHRALKEFLAGHAGEYEIDGDYCDFFGYNATWCSNGFLKKVDISTTGHDLGPVRRLVESGRIAEAFARLNQLKASRVPARDVDYLRGLCFIREKQPGSALEAFKEELRYFPDNQSAARLLEKLAAEHVAKPSVVDHEFLELFNIIRPYTMIGEARLYSLFNLARHVCAHDVPGNFVECGVAAGGSSALLAAVIARHSRRPRRLFSFDTFEGMPAATAEDTSAGKPAESTGWGAGTCAAPEASLGEACRKLDVEKLVEPVRGLFAHTLPATRERIGSIAFLHMDGDWYSSTLDILENLYDQVGGGGRIQIDDYGYWEGCRKAVTEFEQKRGLKFQLDRIDETGVWMAK